MTVEAAYDYASSLVELEQRGSDLDTALHHLEQRYGLSANQIMHLRSRRAKSCDVSLFARLRAIAVEKARGSDGDLHDLAAEADALAAKLAARKAGAPLNLNND